MFSKQCVWRSLYIYIILPCNIANRCGNLILLFFNCTLSGNNDIVEQDIQHMTIPKCQARVSLHDWLSNIPLQVDQYIYFLYPHTVLDKTSHRKKNL